jgi:hypothetical protein
MIRTLSAAVLLALAPLATPAADPEKPDYYPLAEGNKWVYVGTVGGQKIEVTAEVTAVTKKKGKLVATITTRAGGGKEITEELAADAKGVYRSSIAGMKPDRPLTIIKYPLKSGDTWTEKLEISGMELVVETEVGEPADVKVPAGKFKTIPVTASLSIGGQELKSTTWYADKVGMVKQKMTIGDTDVVIELKKFTPAED